MQVTTSEIHNLEGKSKKDTGHDIRFVRQQSLILPIFYNFRKYFEHFVQSMMFAFNYKQTDSCTCDQLPVRERLRKENKKIKGGSRLLSGSVY